MVSGLISLMIIRFLFGMGESGTMPNSVLVISRWFPANETGRALPWMGIGTQIGAAIAPLIIIPIAERYGWRMPFYVNGFIGLLWVLLCFVWFKNFPSDMKKITQKESDYIEVNRRHRAGQHLLPWKFIFSSKTLWALMGMYFCYQWANYFFIAWMPVYLQEKLHFSEKQSGSIIFTLFIVGIVGLLIGGFCIDWIAKKKGLLFGRRCIGMLGIGGTGLSILFAAISSNPNWSAAFLVAANGFYSFGVMAGFAVCTDIGGNNAGTVTGAMNFFGQMGAFFMAIVFGNMVDAGHHFNRPLYIIASALFIGCLLWLLINPTRPMADLQTQDNKKEITT